MKKYTVDPKTAAYSESIEITETTDTNHADNINAAPKQWMTVAEMHQNKNIMEKNSETVDDISDYYGV